MKTVELTDPSQPLLAALLESQGEPVVLCVDGDTIGTVTFKPETDDPPIDVSRSPRLREMLEASHESYWKQGGISVDEVRQKLREWEAEEAAATQST